MVRKVALGNGSLLVNLDSSLRIRDLYFPYAGQENHVLGKKFGIGVQADGFSWIEEWDTTPRYEEDTIVTDSRARNEVEGLEMEFRSCVECEQKVFLREIVVKNLEERPRTVELFFAQDFDMYGNRMADTAAFRPEERGIVHYKKNRYVMLNLRKEEDGCGELEQYGIYRGEVGGAIESGELNGKPIAQGDVQSAVSMKLELPPKGSSKMYYWINTGRDFEQVRTLNEKVDERVSDFFEQTAMCWRGYLGKLNCNTSALPEHVSEQLKRSILVMRSQTNDNGAITAANDSTNLEYNQDKYGYVWPRDASLAVEVMAAAGYGELVKPYFDFAESTLEPGGYLLHKYNPDGSLGSSWHPWVGEQGDKQLPIQEDETALTLWAMERYAEHAGDRRILKEKWDSMARPMAEFLHGYWDFETSLPEPSYDLWEEKRYVSTFTVATVYAALKAAERIADEIGESGEKYGDRAEELKENGLQNLVTDEGYFARGIAEGELLKEVSSPLYFLEKLGMVERDDDRMVQTMSRIGEELSVDTEVGGIARYRGDRYHSQTDDFHRVPGNPWVISTLWMAQYRMKGADSVEELEAASDLMHWSCKNSLETGLLPEQVHPFTGEGLSVAPLTWSHTTFIETAMLYSRKRRQLKGGSS